MPSDFIERARALDKAATEGPWAVDGAAHPGPGDTLIVYPKGDGGAVAYVQPSWGDAEFIAAARSMLPAAVEALARVREMHVKVVTDKHVAGPTAVCEPCSEDRLFAVWPCPTVQAIDQATEAEG